MACVLMLAIFCGFSISFAQCQPVNEGLGLVCGGVGDHDDWLIAGCETHSTLVTHETPGSTTHVLSNGTVKRVFIRTHWNTHI